MRKRWVWIGVAATALILAVFALLPGEPDTLEWLRKHRGEEDVHEGWQLVPGSVYYIYIGSGQETHAFTFTNMPASLIAQLRQLRLKNKVVRPEYKTGQMESGEMISYSIPYRWVRVCTEPRGSWLRQQWIALKRKFLWRENIE
ncbi:MAG: hypothetical protein H7Y17_16350 [Chlorobia bacterium]|nr:hypothetical protein [Fimbriimonadaceae bacterium]